MTSFTRSAPRRVALGVAALAVGTAGVLAVPAGAHAAGLNVTWIPVLSQVSITSADGSGNVAVTCSSTGKVKVNGTTMSPSVSCSAVLSILVDLGGSQPNVVDLRGATAATFTALGNGFVDTGVGADTVYGSYAVDFITASGTIYGGAGDDQLTASGAAKVFGDAGRDNLFGSAANDRLAGGDGDDALYARAIGTATPCGVDFISGQGGNDYLFGCGSEAELNGGPGDDRIQVDLAGTGSTKVFGGLGNDTFETFAPCDRCADRVDSLSLRRTANPAVSTLRADAVSATIQEVESFRASLDVIDLTLEMQATMKVYGGGKIWAGSILVPGGVWTTSTTTDAQFGQVLKVSAPGSAAVRWTKVNATAAVIRPA